MKRGTNKHFRQLLAFLLVGIMLVGGTAMATSARRTETIEVTYDNIKIVLDGKTLDPKDALGNTVEPFIYNGTTYLPVRAVGEAFGKQVGWDGAEKIVYIGAKPGEKESWTDQCRPYSSYDMRLYTDGNSFKMSGKEYTDGYTMRESDATPFGIFNLDGKYNKFTFTFGHVDGTANKDAVLMIYIDEELVFNEAFKWDALAKQFEIPLNGALQMKIVMDGQAYNSYYGIADAYFE